MLSQSFAALLRALSNDSATPLLLEASDRAAALQVAEAIEQRWGGRTEPRVVLVSGSGVDPVVSVIEEMENTLRHIVDEISTFDDHLTFVRVDLTRRRNTANQDAVAEVLPCHACADRAGRRG